MLSVEEEARKRRVWLRKEIGRASWHEEILELRGVNMRREEKMKSTYNSPHCRYLPPPDCSSIVLAIEGA
jgi:hypothetical protein